MSQRQRIGAAEYERRSIDAGREIEPSLDPEAMAMMFNLIRASSRVMKDLESHVLAESGMSFAAFRVMFSLRAVERAAANELARLAGVSTASMSSLLSTLTKNGLIERSEDQDDRRRTIVTLSSAGNELLERLFRVNHSRERAWASTFSPEEAAVFNMLLRRLIVAHPAVPSADEADDFAAEEAVS